MNSSTSTKNRGIILDTNVLSLFAKVGRLDLLEFIVNSANETTPLYLTPVLLDELKAGLERGVDFLSKVFELVDSGKLSILNPTKADEMVISNLPAKLAPGEAESIAICSRLNLVFITHDRKAFNYCERVGIESIRLTTLLDGLKKADIVTESEVEQMLA